MATHKLQFKNTFFNFKELSQGPLDQYCPFFFTVECTFGYESKYKNYNLHFENFKTNFNNSTIAGSTHIKRVHFIMIKKRKETKTYFLLTWWRSQGVIWPWSCALIRVAIFTSLPIKTFCIIHIIIPATGVYGELTLIYKDNIIQKLIHPIWLFLSYWLCKLEKKPCTAKLPIPSVTY